MLKVLLVGMGPLGCAMAGYFANRRTVSLAGVADGDPKIIGADAGELSGAACFSGMAVDGSISGAMERLKPDAVILATVSSLERLIPQIEEAAPFKADIVSTCEELSFPWRTQPGRASVIDEIAKRHGITVLGTGVNPGFLMDYLPSVLTGICREIRSIKVSRIQDASARRVSFRKKIGAGLSPDEFEALKSRGVLRHVGLAESAYMLAAGAGWPIDRVDEELEPVVAGADVRMGDQIIEKGRALGVQQKATGYLDGREALSLLFRAAVGEAGSRDTIEIDGDPSFTSTISGGINGDTATCSVTVNAVKSAVSAPAGLRTMIDVPVVSYSA